MSDLEAEVAEIIGWEVSCNRDGDELLFVDDAAREIVAMLKERPLGDVLTALGYVWEDTTEMGMSMGGEVVPYWGRSTPRCLTVEIGSAHE
jgi:hypothetical protein